MNAIPKTRFLGHSLIHRDGETQGEKAARTFGASGADYADTLRRFPPTRVSIEEFERDMRAPSRSHGEEHADGR